MPFFEASEYEDDMYVVQRAVDVIRQAMDIQADQELMEKVLEELKCQKESIDMALDTLGGEGGENLDPDDPDSRVEKFIQRLALDRGEEARKTNETPKERRSRINKKRPRMVFD